MKIFNSTLKLVLLMAAIFSCRPDEIVENTGPLFVSSVVAEGTDHMTGAPVTIEVVPNESQIPLDAVITVNFSKNVDPATVSGVSLTQDDTPVDAAVSASGASIIIDPAASLEFGTRYTITLPAEVRAADGGLLLEPMTRSFTSQTAAPTVYDGAVFYMSFDGNFTESISGQNATVVGTPGFAGEGVKGDAYAGSADSYLTFPTTGLLNEEFSAVFWMKVNGTPDRAGVLVIGPPDPNLPATPNNRTAGFRFFREAAGAMQRFKLNVGTGSGESWFDGGAAADVDPTEGDWVHFAFSIAEDQATVYIDGEVASQGPFDGVSWTGTDILSIMSGVPRFMEWGHLSDLSFMDELRLFNKALTQEDVQAIIRTETGEIFNMPFDGHTRDVVSDMEATVVGTPGFAGESVVGTDAYAGAADAYLTFPGETLQHEQFSASFWLKINAVPDRAGILVMGPPDPNLPATPNNRTAGFRFFREAAGAMQRFKLNVGNGTADSWFDGGAAADVDPSSNEWVHFAFTISDTECVVYINGNVVSQGAFDGVDWTGCDVLSIMSGAPRFTEWGHLSDQSYMDDLRIFNKVLTQADVENLMDAD